MQFMPSSLDKLVKNLAPEQFHHTRRYWNVRQKGGPTYDAPVAHLPCRCKCRCDSSEPPRKLGTNFNIISIVFFISFTIGSLYPVRYLIDVETALSIQLNFNYRPPITSPSHTAVVVVLATSIIVVVRFCHQRSPTQSRQLSRARWS